MKYRVTIETDDDGVYCASVPALPGCHSDGRTRDEAIANITEAIEAYIESLRLDGDPMPAGNVESEGDVVEIELEDAA